MAYNPLIEFTSLSELGEMPFLNIERQPTDEGEDWAYHHRLIGNLLRHLEEVADCSVDPDGQTVYVTLTEELHGTDDIERADVHLREIIGRVACFDYTSQHP